MGLLARLFPTGDFRRVAAAGAASLLGDWLFEIGLLTYVWDRTHSAAWLAAIEVVALVASVLFASVGGDLADRFPRRHVLVASELAGALLLFVLAFATWRSASPWLVAAIVFGVQAVTAPRAAAVLAITPELVPVERLHAANASLGGVEHAALAAGPALGALVLVLGSPPFAFVLDGATFLVSAFVLAGIAARPAPGGDRVAYLTRLRAGAAAVVGAHLVPLIAYWAAAGFLYGLEVVLVPIAADELLGIGANGYGWLLAAAGVGGLVAAPGIGLSRLQRPLTVAAVSLFLLAVPFSALAGLHTPVAGAAVWAVAGVGTMLGTVAHDTLLQRRIDGELLGNVSGAFNTLYAFGVMAGSVSAPALVAVFDVRTALVGAGVGGAVVAAVGLPWARRADRRTSSA